MACRPKMPYVLRVLREVSVQLALKELDDYDWPLVKKMKRQRGKALARATSLVHRLDRYCSERREKKAKAIASRG